MLFMPDDFKFKWSEAPEGTSPLPVDIPTPNFDRVRDEGAVFERAYTASPKCAPSRFALLTGRYPSRGVYAVNQARQNYRRDANWNGRTYIEVPQTKITDSDAVDNLQTALKGAGYETIHSGKWHLFPGGLDDGYLSDYSSLMTAIEATGFTTVASAYIANMGSEGETDGTNTWSHNYEWLVSTSLAAVTTAVQNAKPFFLYFAPTGPHSPKTYNALFDFTARQTPAGVLSTTPVTTMRSREDLWAAAEALHNAQSVQNTLAGGMWVDDALGALLDGLEDLDVLDNTLVVVCLDHGVEGKSTLAETGTRIMQAVRYPGVSEGTVVSSVVSNIDTAATMLAVAGVVPQYTLDGVSWLAEVQGSVPATTFPKVMEFGLERAVIAGGFKYYEGALYDLASDPEEETDLSGVLTQAATLATMQEYMACHDTDTSAQRSSSGTCTQNTIANVFANTRSGSVLSVGDVRKALHGAAQDSVPLWAVVVMAAMCAAAAVVVTWWCLVAKRSQCEKERTAAKAVDVV